MAPPLSFLMISLFFVVAAAVAVLILRNYKAIKKFLILRSRAIKAFTGLPGPPCLPVIGCAHLFSWNNVEFSRQLFEWDKLYMQDGIVRAWLGPVPLVCLARGHTVKPILESSKLITKPARPGYSFLTKWIGEGLLTSTGSKWFGRRRLLTPTFHFSILQSYHDVFGKHGRVLVKLLEKEANGNVFDIFPYFKRCALDIICETAMGTEIGSQTGKNMDYVKGVIRLSDIIWKHERLPWFWFAPVWYLSGLGFEFDRLVKETTNFTRRVIAERKAVLQEGGARRVSISETGKEREAFLDMLIDMQKEEKLSDEDIREEVDTFMFEGHDTTSAAMGFAVWYLGNHPEYQAKVHEEMDAVFGDSSREPTLDDLKQCVYLERCIKESLRLSPSVPIIARELTEDVKIGDRTFPEGLTVILGIFACHRDPESFERPNEFYPDHFDMDKAMKRDPYSVIPFSAGPRNCIGQKFAIQEEKAVLSWFFRRYRVRSTDDFETNPPVAELILKPSKGFRVILEKR